MKTCFCSLVLLLTVAGLTHAQAPAALDVQLAMNEGLEREFPTFQEIVDVQILRGGLTARGDYLFLCSGRLMWKMSSTDFGALLQKEVDETRPEPGENDTLWRAVALSLSNKLQRIGQFAAGGTVSKVRFRVRLEKAGEDWIVSEATVKESERNPLYIIDKPTP